MQTRSGTTPPPPMPQFSASMASFMVVVTLTANPLWCMVSILVVLATRPSMNASAAYARYSARDSSP